MRGSLTSGIVLLLMAAGGAAAAERISVTKTIPASAGPWTVTLSINLAYPYSSGHSAPVVFDLSDGFGFQPGDVLTVQYQAGMWCGGTYVSLGTCVDANGYRNRAPANDQPGGASGTYGPSKYMDPASYPIYWMELVGTFADDRGQILGTPFKIGNGPVNASVPSGATRLQLGSNYYDYGNARNYFTPLTASVTGPPPPTMKPAGTMAQLASGGLWKTTFVLLNSGTRPALARLNFFDDQGNALPLPLSFPESAGAEPLVTAALERTLAAGASLTIETEDRRSTEPKTGWAQLLTDGDLSGFAIFGSQSGSHDQEAVVPLETRGAPFYNLWFNNTGGLVTSVALANPSTQAVKVAVTIRDEGGQTLATDSIPLAARGHIAFGLPDRLPSTAKRRGTVEFRTPESGQLSVLGLRFNPGAFTTVPALTQ